MAKTPSGLTIFSDRVSDSTRCVTTVLESFDVAGPFSQMLRAKPPDHDYPNVRKWRGRMLAQVPAWRKTRDGLEARVVELNKNLRIHLAVLDA